MSDTPLKLEEIEARRERVMSRDNPSKLAEVSILIHGDIPALLALVRKQQWDVRV